MLTEVLISVHTLLTEVLMSVRTVLVEVLVSVQNADRGFNVGTKACRSLMSVHKSSDRIFDVGA